MTMFGKKINFGPQEPPCPTPEARHRRQNENPVLDVLYLLLVRTHKTFGTKFLEIDFVIQI